MVGSLRAQHFQKSKKFHQLQKKWFNFKPLTPTHLGEAVLGDTGRGRRKVGVRKLERRKVEGGRREGGVKEEGRQEGGLR